MQLANRYLSSKHRPGLKCLMWWTFGLANGLFAGTPQTISFPELTDHLNTDVPFVLQATASSALTVTFSIVSPSGVATVAGDIVSLSGTTGAVTVKASQDGDNVYEPAPDVYRTFVVGDANQRFIKIASGPMASHAFGIRPDGTLWAWGSNSYGQLGDGSTTDRYSPVQVGSDTNWVSIAGGTNHSLGVRSDGTLWAWGSGGNGQVGDGTGIQRLSPVQVGSDTNWASVSCGPYHSAGVRSDGTLWTWGYNFWGQLGDGTTTQRLSPAQVGSDTNWASVVCSSRHTVGLRTDGTLWAWGDGDSGRLGTGSSFDQPNPVQIGTATDWAMIACGSSHTVGLRSDGTLWAWGVNYDGQLGNGSSESGNKSPVQVGTATDWAAVYAGASHTLAVRSDGTLWAWGSNLVCQLGDGTLESRTSPVQVGSATNWGQLAGGSGNTYGLRTDGTFWAWGNKSNGRLGNGEGAMRQLSPQRVGREVGWTRTDSSESHSLALREDSTLWAWGDNSVGALGTGSLTSLLIPVRIGSSAWISTAGGASSSAGVCSDGTLWTWGNNISGELGIGGSTNGSPIFSSPQQVGSSTSWVSVARGSMHAFALRTDGTLWAWGSNFNGQLGDGSTSERRTPVQVGDASNWVAVAGGQNHSAGVRSDGTLWTWGFNIYSQLGDNTTTQRLSPVQVGSATNWVAVACGYSFTAALRSDGTLWAWGRNDMGQVGNNTTLRQTTPARVGMATNWTSVACGANHTVGLRSDGTLWAWGLNDEGQLGDASTVTRTSPVQVGTAMSWTSISGGYKHTMAVRSDGALWSWGLDDDGQLGLRLQSSPKRVWPLRESQSLTFSPLPTALVAGQSTGLTATSSSGLPAAYAVDGKAFLQGSQMTTTVRGTARATAYQNGDTAWASAEPAVQYVSVINQTDIAIQGSGIEIASGDVTPSVLDDTDFGNVTLVNAQATRTFVIANQGASVLLINGTPKVTIGGLHPQDFKVTVQPSSSVASGGNTSFTITFDPTLYGARLAMVSVASDDLEKTPYTFAIGGFCTTSAPLKQTITFNPPSKVYVGMSPLTLTAYSDSGLPVTLSLATGNATLTNNVLSAGSPRTVTVQASQSGAGNYAAALPVLRPITFIDDPGVLTLIKLNQTYDGTPKPIGALGTSLAATITYKVGAAYVPDAPTNAGSYAVKAVAGGVTKTGTLVIAKAPLVVTPDDKRKFTGRVNPALTSVIVGFKGSDTAAVFTKAPLLSTTATTASPGGLYPIKSSGGIAPNYTFIHRQGTLVVESFAGSYEALLVDGTLLPVGKLSLTVAAGNAFTGKLYTAEETAALPLSGLLATDTVNGQASGQVTLLKNGIPYVTRFTLPMYGDMLADVTRDYLTLGSAHDGRKLNEQTVCYSGAHTAVLEPAMPAMPAMPAAATVPAGAGWATANISTKGVMTLTGKLAEGTAFTTILTPDREGTPGYRLFVQPYKTGPMTRAHSFLAGTFTLASHPILINRRYLEQGVLTWKKEGAVADASYRVGFGPVNTVLMIDPWLPPTSARGTTPAITLAQRLGLTGSSFDVSHSATGNATHDGNLPTRVTLSTANAARVTSPLANTTKWKASFVSTTGTFTGSFELVDGLQKRLVPFSGVLRQPAATTDALIGVGHLLLPALPTALSNEKLSGEVQFLRP